MTKYIAAIIFALTLSPSVAFAQYPPVNATQGGTGWNGIAQNAIPYGLGASNLRIGTSSAFSFNPSAARLSFTYGSTTALTAISLCISTDCRSAWPGGVSTATYPLVITGSDIALAFGTTTKNDWSAHNTFASFFATLASTTNATTTGSQYITSLATAAGAFLAIDPNGKVIATSTPSGGSGTPAGSNTYVQYNKFGTFGGDSFLAISTSSAIATLTVGDSTFPTGKLRLANGVAPPLGYTTLSAGTSGATVNITIPDASGTLVVGTGASNRLSYWSGTNTLTSDAALTYNSSPGRLSFTYGSSTSLTTSGATWLAANGGNLGFGTSTPSPLWGATFATSTVFNGVQFGGTIASTTPSAATYTVNWESGNTQRFILDQSSTFIINSTSSNPHDGHKYILKICQDTTGSRTATFATPAQLVWSKGTTTVSSAASTGTMIGLIYDGRSGRYDVVASTTISDTRACLP